MKLIPNRPALPVGAVNYSANLRLHQDCVNGNMDRLP